MFSYLKFFKFCPLVLKVIFHSIRIVLEAKLLAALQSKWCAFGSVKIDICLRGERTDSYPLHRKRTKVMLLVYSSCFWGRNTSFPFCDKVMTISWVCQYVHFTQLLGKLWKVSNMYVARCTRAPFQQMFISLKVGFLFSRFSGILQPKVDSAGTQLQQNLPQILPQNSEALPFKIAK